jgi:hypothetical protein
LYIVFGVATVEGIGGDAYKELVAHFIFLSKEVDGCQTSVPL